jgi:hypothetical protein
MEQSHLQIINAIHKVHKTNKALDKNKRKQVVII